ncbi:MAG: hypothetical protein AAGU27_07905 [Dehalobacterium sp.]
MPKSSIFVPWLFSVFCGQESLFHRYEAGLRPLGLGFMSSADGKGIGTGACNLVCVYAAAGVLADRYDRRLLMVPGDSLSAAGLVFILICMLCGEASCHSLVC